MTEPTWYPGEDWSTVKVGERVRLENPNNTAVEMDVLGRGTDWIEGVLVRPLFLHDGWALFITRPPVELPTEPGLYIDKEDDAWRLDEAGRWLLGRTEQTLAWAESFAPFTRLRPEGEEAREILTAIEAGEKRVRTLDGGWEFIVSPDLTRHLREKHKASL